MFKREADQMIQRAGGLLEVQEIEVRLINGSMHKLQIGQSWQEADGWGYEGTRPTATFEIIGFAAPQARGRIDKWDADAEVSSVLLQKSTSHASDEYHIRSAWDCNR